MELFLIIFFCLCLFFPVLHLFHCLPWFREEDELQKAKPEKEKGISILVPCYNEAKIIETSIHSMRSLAYSNFEVIYVNDGSTDETFSLLDDELKLRPSWKTSLGELTHKPVDTIYQSELYPNIFVVDKVNGGKADALNAGIEYASKELVVTLDADTILTAPALSAVNNKFTDPDVVAAGGMVHVLQTKTDRPLNRLSLSRANLLVRVQVLDFLKAFYVTKLSLTRFQALAIISGAFGIFTKKVLLEVSGYRSSVGEDIDITLKIQRYIARKKNKKILMITDALSYTELPETWRDLFKQRIRWQKSYMDCLVHFFGFLSRTVFTKSVSFFYIIESFLVGILAVYITAGFFVANIWVNETFAFMWFIIVYLSYIFSFNFIYNLLALSQAKQYGLTFSAGDKIRLFFIVVYDVLIHRFVIMYFVMYGSIAYFFNRDWKKVDRTGRKYDMETVPTTTSYKEKA